MPTGDGQDRGDRRSARPRLGLLLLTAAVVLACLAVAVGFAGGQAWGRSDRAWLIAALCSRVSVVCGLVILLGAVALALTAGMLWQAGSAERPRRRGQEGVAILELALVLPFALMLVLIMVQSSFLLSGNLCVHYAAFCAARSAVVHVPRDAGAAEPRNVVAHWDDPGASAKVRRIREAAVWAVMPVSCSSARYRSAGETAVLAGGLERFFLEYQQEVPGWARRDYLAPKLRYADDYTFVRLTEPEEGQAYKVREDIEVTVTHTLYLSVPYASRIFSAVADGVALDFAEGEYGLRIEAVSRLPNEGVQDWIEVETFGS